MVRVHSDMKVNVASVHVVLQAQKDSTTMRYGHMIFSSCTWSSRWGIVTCMWPSFVCTSNSTYTFGCCNCALGIVSYFVHVMLYSWRGRLDRAGNVLDEVHEVYTSHMPHPACSARETLTTVKAFHYIKWNGVIELYNDGSKLRAVPFVIPSFTTELRQFFFL